MSRTFPLPVPSALPADAKPAKPSLFRRLFAALIESRQRQAERDVARYLARTGLKFTDSVEREVERQFLHRPFI